jgi:hypothetical protein
MDRCSLRNSSSSSGRKTITSSTTTTTTKTTVAATTAPRPRPVAAIDRGRRRRTSGGASLAIRCARRRSAFGACRPSARRLWCSVRKSSPDPKRRPITTLAPNATLDASFALLKKERGESQTAFLLHVCERRIKSGLVHVALRRQCRRGAQARPSADRARSEPPTHDRPRFQASGAKLRRLSRRDRRSCRNSPPTATSRRCACRTTTFAAASRTWRICARSCARRYA